MNTSPERPNTSAQLAPFRQYDGSTYYGRPQLKAAPFKNTVVGGYIFLAGLSGGSAILSALTNEERSPASAGMARRGRYLSLLAPVLGAPLLIYDLHTPKRFYNMFRVAKSTSPMSIGTWILTGFSVFAGLAGAAQAGADVWPRRRLFAHLARRASVPAAIAGAGLTTYTASLLSATSTPIWAAAPQSLGVRFGASSMAAAAAALSLSETNTGVRGKLEAIAAGALLTEAVAAAASHDTYRRKGIEAAFDGPAGQAEKLGANLVGVALPLGLLVLSKLLARRRDPLANLASLAVLAGSAALRVSIMGVGDASASQPDVSFRFSTPQNLPGGQRKS